MDLSRLYYKGFAFGAIKDNADVAFAEWKINSELCVGEKFEFSNIQMVEVPAYYFNCTFQKVEHVLENEERAYRESDGTRFPVNPINIFSLTPNNFPVDEIPAISKETRPAEKDKHYVITNSKSLYKCPNCKGTGYSTCPECKGSLKVICPICKYSGKAGYIKREENYIVCPTCAQSRYGRGFIVCTKCNEKGVVTCSRCNSTGMVVKYVSRKDFYIPTETSVVHWHESIPDGMKSFMKSPDIFFVDDEVNKIFDTDDIFKCAETDVLFETEEKIEDILNSFSEPNFQNVKKQVLDKMREISSKTINDENGERVLSKITKAHIKAYKINIVCVSYECNSTNYCLWIYGNKNIYTQDSPFLAFIKSHETEADNLISRKKYLKAIHPLEKACKISSTSKNFESLRECRQKLITARKKTNLDFDIGAFIGLILTAIFYLFVIKNYSFEYPSSKNFFITVLNIHSEKALTVLTKIVNVILNYGLPYDICCAVFGHVIRDKIKNRIFRVFLPILLISLYTVSMVFLCTNFIHFRVWGFVATGVLLFVVSAIVQLTVKIPYKGIPKINKN